MQQQCCCAMSVSGVGIWHVLHRHCPSSLKEDGPAHVVGKHRDLHSLRTCVDEFFGVGSTCGYDNDIFTSD